MLVIRLQRAGRKGHAQYRVVVQDSRFSPTSGRVIAYVGSYNPHTKAAKLDKEKIEGYLANGAQPSPRVVGLLKSDKIKLPKWVEETAAKKRSVRNPEKRRSTSPAQTSASEVSAGKPPEGAPEPAKEPEAPAEEDKQPAEEAKQEAVKASEEAEAPAEPAES